MILRTLFTAFFLMLVCATVYGAKNNASADQQPGVARELARWRATHYSNVRYKLNVSLMPGAESLKGSEEIRVTLDGEVTELVLDWRTAPPKAGQSVAARVWDIEVNGREVKDALLANDHILIPGAYLVKGENVLRLKFESPISTSGSAVTRYLIVKTNRNISTRFLCRRTRAQPSPASTSRT